MAENKLERILILAGTALALSGFGIGRGLGDYMSNPDLIYIGRGIMLGGAACFVFAQAIDIYKPRLNNN